MEEKRSFSIATELTGIAAALVVAAIVVPTCAVVDVDVVVVGAGGYVGRGGKPRVPGGR